MVSYSHGLMNCIIYIILHFTRSDSFVFSLHLYGRVYYTILRLYMSILYSRGSQLAARGPHPAREAIFSGLAMNFYQGGNRRRIQKKAVQANSKDATKKVLTIGYTLKV